VSAGEKLVQIIGLPATRRIFADLSEIGSHLAVQ